MAITVPPPAAATVALPQFFGRANATQTIVSANAYVAVALQAEDLDDDNGHDPSTNNSRYVAKRAGRFTVQGTALVASGQATTTNTTLRIARLAKNGTTYLGGSITYGTYTGLPLSLVTITVPVTLALNDYLELQVASGLANTQLVADATDGSSLRVDFVR